MTEYYPQIALMLFWLFAAFLPSLLVQRPNITLLGLITAPAVFCVVLSIIKLKNRVD
jgi:hypothetical protein